MLVDALQWIQHCQRLTVNEFVSSVITTLLFICPKLTPSSSRSGGSVSQHQQCKQTLTIRISCSPKRCQPSHSAFHAVLFLIPCKRGTLSTHPCSLHTVSVSALGICNGTSALRVWELVLITYRIDCNLTSRIGVGLNRCAETLLHRLWWFCTALVEIVGSGTAHSLPCLSLATTFRVKNPGNRCCAWVRVTLKPD